jgi:hypothetical protein
MPDLRVKLLEEGDIGLAYPLVLRAARVQPARWAAFARELREAGGDIIGAWAEDGQLLGVATYRPTDSLRQDATLAVELIVAFEMSRDGPVRRALCAALEEIARRLGCASVSYTLAAAGSCEADSSRRRRWEELGLSLQTFGFVRSL